MKKQHRFLINKLPATEHFSVSEKELVHLIKNVLKLSVGETCRLFCAGSDDVLVTITNIEKEAIAFKTLSTEPKVQIPCIVSAALCITKRDTFELTVQKLTELGVKTIIPIISDRTIKQSIRIERLQKISDEAVEQSGHSQKVFIGEPQTLEATLTENSTIDSFYFDTDTKEGLPSKNKVVCFYIGPEGGWSDREKELFKAHNVSPATLGDTVLRAETAAIVAAYTLIWH